MLVDDTKVTVEGLQEGTVYMIRVATEGQDGVRGEERVIEAMTVIDRLQSHEVLKVTESSIELIQRGLPNKLSLDYLAVSVAQVDRLERAVVEETWNNFTVPITKGLDEVKFILEDLIPGTTYGIQIQLHARFGELPIITNPGPLAPVTTEITGGGEERLLRLVEELKRAVAEKASLVRGNLDSDMASLASLDADCMAERAHEMVTILEERLERNFTLMQEIMTGSLGAGICTYPGAGFFPSNTEEENLIESLPCKTDAKCQSMCKMFWDCESVTWKQPAAYNSETVGRCLMYKRRGRYLFPMDYAVGANRVCSEVVSATADKYDSCVKRGSYYNNAHHYQTSAGFPRLFDCIMWCVNSWDCNGVSYNPVYGDCTLNYGPIDFVEGGSKVSVSLDCLRGIY